MIHARRVAHARMTLGMAIATAALLAGSLLLRPELPPPDPADAQLFEVAGFASPLSADAARLETGVAVYTLERRGPDVLALQPDRVILEPDLLVYWSPEPGAEAPTGASRLLGRLAGTAPRRLRLPPAAREPRGELLLYSLPDGSVVDRIPLAGALAETP